MIHRELKSPSKYLGLKKLEEIRDNGFISASNIEYVPSEVTDLINSKLAKSIEHCSVEDIDRLWLEDEKRELKRTIRELKIAIKYMSKDQARDTVLKYKSRVHRIGDAMCPF